MIQEEEKKARQMHKCHCPATGAARWQSTGNIHPLEKKQIYKGSSVGQCAGIQDGEDMGGRPELMTMRMKQALGFAQLPNRSDKSDSCSETMLTFSAVVSQMSDVQTWWNPPFLST